jgi:hypothetical protein
MLFKSLGYNKSFPEKRKQHSFTVLGKKTPKELAKKYCKPEYLLTTVFFNKTYYKMISSPHPIKTVLIWDFRRIVVENPFNIFIYPCSIGAIITPSQNS